MIQEVIPDKKSNAYLYDAVLIFNFILMLSFDSIQFLTKLPLQLITFLLLNFHTSSAPLLHKGTEKDMRSGGVQGADEPIERGRAATRSRCLDDGIERGSGQRPEALVECRSRRAFANGGDGRDSRQSTRQQTEY